MTAEINGTVEVIEVVNARGARGKSAYEVAQDGGFTGTQEEWLASLEPDPSAFATAAQGALADTAVQAADLTTAVGAAVSGLVAGAPGALDTLNELAAALGDDANFAATVSTALAGKQAIATLDADVAAKLDTPGSALRTSADSRFVPHDGFRGFRARDFPGAAGIPTVDAALGTVALSAAGAATSIASAQEIRPSRMSFRPMHTEPTIASTYPNYLGWNNAWTSTTAGGWAVEFDLDTVAGVFEVKTKGDGGKISVMVDGKYLSPTPLTLTPGGSLYNVIVTLASGGMRRIRLEMDGTTRFFGVYVGATDGVYAAPRRPMRALWVGDSFAEPTISDSGGSHHGQGMVPMFGWATGWEVIPAGRGGTGFVTPGAYVKYADRLAELLAVPNLDVVIFQMTANDSGQTTAAVLTQAQACFTAAKAAGFTKYGQIIFMASWWPRYSMSIPARMIDQDIAVRLLCDTEGIIYVDTLIPQVSGAVTTTLASAITSGQSQLVVTDRIPSLAQAPAGNAAGGEWFVQIGNPGSETLEIRQFTSYSGSGPYTLALSSAVTNNHSVGEQVVQVGKGVLTGNGYQGATTGSGTSDRFTGTDGTHSTVAGSRWRALAYAARLQSLIPR